MATFKTEIRKHQQRADGSYNVKLRITHKRRSRWIPTNIDVTADDLTTRGDKIKTRAVLDRCEDLLRRVRADVARLSPFALEEMSVEQVAEWIRKEERGEGWRLDFFEWGRECVAGMSEGARGHYTRALHALARYLGRDTLDINELRAMDIRGFGAYLDTEPKARTSVPKKVGGVSRTYISALSRLHTLARNCFNDPDAERQLIPRNPFDGYRPAPAPKIRGGQTSLGIEGIQALIDARPEDRRERQAVALFLISFCLMGANLADLYDAPPVSGDTWIYRRRKVVERKGADAEIRVRVPDCVRPLLAEFPDPTARRWLGLWAWSASRDAATQKVNIYLRRWQARAGMRDFTFYAARHSWGTLAHGRAGFNRDTVDEAMGHNGNLDLADIYIEKDWDMLNRINAGTLALFDWSKPR